ncbi:hypothetical protein [Psychrobacillus lasiicapitis]|uniref:Lipoprotein n=1 Tax=Psychrobacillus lasiicapitis TaxID=1636719 RepID=A0A544SRE2_9BACI|nr:hypothetical protein [Psychrobacillus lasiicapitis]TQR07776.1 hypothetical protein FG382_22270 [Psychrobacillus lasiicapitis]GGA49005.1 hypothetical protein GCM10011384_43380 [Psychrobacillus lasiicapitis]
MNDKTSRLIIVLITVITTILLTACQNGTEEPAIKISSNSVELSSIYYGDLYNEEEVEIEQRLKDFMVGKRFIDLPMIAYGDNIEIEPLNFETGQYEVYDYIVNEKGNIISDYDIPINITSNKEGQIEFTFEESYDFESYKDYAVQGKLIHCILIRCEIDNHSFAFATLVLSGK